MAVRRRERSVVTTEIRPINLEIAFTDDGQAAKGAHIVEAVFIDGEFMRLLPAKPLAESTVEAVADYAAAFSASVVAQVTALTAERDAALAGVQSVTATMQAEIDRLTLLVPPPVPDAFLNADWPQFRVRILSDPAVQRVASGNSTAWPLMILYLAQLSSTPSRGLDIAQLWTFMESQTPVTPEEVARINAIASECGVPLQMNEDGSIG